MITEKYNSIFDAINAGEYDNKLEFPDSLRKPVLKSRTPSVQEMNRYLAELEEYQVKKEAFDAALKAYRNETQAKEEQFKSDLETFYDVARHPKADLLFSKAWMKGHALGLSEIASNYDDMVDLII